MENPKYSEHCLKNMFDMVIECNSRIRAQGLDTNAAETEHMSTEPGWNYAETNAKEERAWKQLCRVHGNSTPKTDFHRIEFLLALCEKYQGHNKTKRTLLKELHRRNTTLTNVPFNVARLQFQSGNPTQDLRPRRDFSCFFASRDGTAGLRVTGWGSTHALHRTACSLLKPSHTRTVSPSGEVFSRRFLAPAMRPMAHYLKEETL